jgi:hypothetical protein
MLFRKISKNNKNDNLTAPCQSNARRVDREIALPRRQIEVKLKLFI